jgi:hypothetical protein
MQSAAPDVLIHFTIEETEDRCCKKLLAEDDLCLVCCGYRISLQEDRFRQVLTQS